MKVYWADSVGLSPFIKQTYAKDSSTSNASVKVAVGKGSVLFQQTEYRIAGFSLTVEELRTLLQEVTAYEKHKVVACYGNEKTGDAWYLVQPEGDYKAPREDGYAYFAEYPYASEFEQSMAAKEADNMCKNFTESHKAKQKLQHKGR